MTILFEGQKHWKCRVLPLGVFELFVTNNPKVDVKFAASHFLSSRLNRDKREFEGGLFTVAIIDLADQVTYEVTIKRFVEETQFNKRIRTEIQSVKKVTEL